MSASRQLRLPDADEIRAREILEVVWPYTFMAAAMTKTRWKQINKAVALDMARVGITNERIIAAHAAVSKRIGAPARTLRIVQDQLVRELPAVHAPARRPANVLPD